jgi:hypothetical protein
MKYEVLEILDELESDVQSMRENGETDLRSVLHLIDVAIRQVRAMEEPE